MKHKASTRPNKHIISSSSSSASNMRVWTNSRYRAPIRVKCTKVPPWPNKLRKTTREALIWISSQTTRKMPDANSNGNFSIICRIKILKWSVKRTNKTPWLQTNAVHNWHRGSAAKPRFWENNLRRLLLQTRPYTVNQKRVFQIWHKLQTIGILLKLNSTKNVQMHLRSSQTVPWPLWMLKYKLKVLSSSGRSSGLLRAITAAPWLLASRRQCSRMSHLGTISQLVQVAPSRTNRLELRMLLSQLQRQLTTPLSTKRYKRTIH